MTAFRRNMNAGGAPEGAERGCGPDPWNLCRSSYRREAATAKRPLPACKRMRDRFFREQITDNGGEIHVLISSDGRAGGRRGRSR